MYWLEKELMKMVLKQLDEDAKSAHILKINYFCSSVFTDLYKELFVFSWQP